MKVLNNERGGALLLVLFGLILVTMFAMFQLKQIVTVRQQIEVAEVDIDARNIANMGLIHFREEVRFILDGYKEDPLNPGAGLEQFIRNGTTTSRVTLDDDHFFKVDFIGYDNNLGIVKYISTGTAFDKSIIENGSFKIEKMNVSELNPVSN